MFFRFNGELADRLITVARLNHETFNCITWTIALNFQIDRFVLLRAQLFFRQNQFIGSFWCLWLKWKQQKKIEMNFRLGPFSVYMSKKVLYFYLYMMLWCHITTRSFWSTRRIGINRWYGTNQYDRSKYTVDHFDFFFYYFSDEKIQKSLALIVLSIGIVRRKKKPLILIVAHSWFLRWIQLIITWYVSNNRNKWIKIIVIIELCAKRNEVNLKKKLRDVKNRTSWRKNRLIFNCILFLKH